MRTTTRQQRWNWAIVATLVVATFAACGDDDDQTDTAATSTTTGGQATNELDVEMIDYAYKVNGAIQSGLVTINSVNTGQEWHMAAYGRLKPGKTAADLTKALQEQGGGPEGGEQEDPTAEFIEEEMGSPGHILQPGQRQSLTVELEPGNYVMMCFIPTEGEGTPHFAKGMVSSFEVGDEQAEVAAPKEDAAITLPDNAEPTGVPPTVASGRRTFKLTSAGTKGKDFAIGQITSGEPNEPATFDKYFGTVFEQEGGPPKGAAKQAPGTLYGMTFEVDPGQAVWLTVDLKAGEVFFVNTTNAESESDEDQDDRFVKVQVT